MNGDVNGTMTEPVEPMEVKLPHSPVSKSDQTKVTPEDCDYNTNDCESRNFAETCNDIDSDLKNCSTDNGMPEGSSNDISDCTLQNNCENSNQSDADSTSSSHQKFELSDIQIIQEGDNESKDNNSVKDNGQIGDINQDSLDEDDSDGELTAEGSPAECRAEDTVSINSDSEPEDEDEDDTSQEGQNKISDIIILDGENRPASISSEVHEIVSDNENDNDDCVIATEEKADSNNSEEKVQLRRSSRTVKRKQYNYEVENGDEDVDEELGPSLKRKAKPIVINDTKVLVAMAAKQMKSNHNNFQKKEPTVVIIDTNSITSGKVPLQHNKTSSSLTNAGINAQNLYQSIVARGTTVTPVSSKTHNNSTQISPATQNTQPAILPSLSDDMFVVEAPSFIVPYVYEKPSVKPFREFVDKLGKELEEEKIKEEFKEKEKKEKEKQDKKERGEEILTEDDSNMAVNDKSEEKDEVKKKKSKKEQKRRQNDEDDVSWDGESASQSDDDVLSDEDDKIVVKDKIEPIEQINAVSDLTVDKICSNKSNGFSSMDCSLGKFFINIGLNLVQEYVQSDLLKQQNRKLYKEKKAGHSTKLTESSIAQLMKNLNLSKENNAPYSFSQQKCEFCSFKTESKLVMAQHLETPHMKNNMYKCNFCTFEIRSPHDILFHMEAEHNIRGKLERAPSYHQCANCPFEDNGKGKLARHLIACAKKFKPDSNLAPPVDWEPPAKIPKIARPRNNIMTPYQNSFNRAQMGTTIRSPINVSGMVTNVGSYRPRGRSPMTIPPRNPPVHGVAIMRGNSMIRQNTPTHAQMSNSYPVVNNAKPKSLHQPSISITPLPRHPQPVQQSQPSNIANNKSTFVICEICDGYIKDLEQLRNHMQWIHKVKIHPKMIYNRPPLNCQKCQFRFFTDQGLERHLLGSHGLVTSSMQEAANKGKDAGRCPVCGRVYQWKLLSHVARDHNLTLKPAHLSYKCTVCTATFGMYKQFENHVYSAHSVVAKRVMDKSKSSTPKSNNDTLLKPLKINDEITIIPQPVKTTPTSAKDK